jgi:nucleoside-diphosphate-sugar epimerase
MGDNGQRFRERSKAVRYDLPVDRSEILVTGGTGFLGRRLVIRLLEHGRRVTLFARAPDKELEFRGARFIRGTLEDVDAVRAACRNMDAVFHVAAKVGVWGRYEDFFRVNVLATRAVLEGCRQHGVKRLIYTSTPSVVYNGMHLMGANESLALTTNCPSPYPLTKAIAEREVIAANSAALRTVALRPHLIWGVGDPHLVPRLLARAKAGRLRIIGDGTNKVDMVHVENAVDAHMLAEDMLATGDEPVAGHAYFVTNGEPVVLWEWINQLLRALDLPPVTKKISLPTARRLGAGLEFLWRVLHLKGEPPLTRFVATELAK